MQSHADGNCSITGGVVVRDRGVSLRGRYVFGDFCKGRIFKAKLARGQGERRQADVAAGPEPLLVRRGRAAAASTSPRSSGPVYRIASK